MTSVYARLLSDGICMAEIDRMDLLTYIDVLIYEAEHKQTDMEQTGGEAAGQDDGAIWLQSGTIDNIF